MDVNGLMDSFTVEEPEEPSVLPTPAGFEYGGLVISPSSVDPGTDVSISVDVENISRVSSSETVELPVDGVVVDTERVTLVQSSQTTHAYTTTPQ